MAKPYLHTKHDGPNLPSGLVLPQCEKGIGDVILHPESPKLIDGVKCAR